MRRAALAGFAAWLALGARASAQQASTATATLEERVRILERRLEATTAQSKAAPSINANPFSPDGFGLRSADGAFRLRIGGAVQADDRAFLTTAAQGADQFLIRRARLYLEGVVQKYVEFRVLPDFAAGQPLLEEAYVDLDYTKAFRVQAGKFKSPLGLERLQAEVNTLFIERGLTADLEPNRDTGVQIHGELLGRALTYQAALVNGAPDGAVFEGDTENNKDFVGRLFVRPFKASGSPMWEELGLGVGGSVGRQQDGGAGSLATYATETQRTFFTYANPVVSAGARRRLAPQAYWYPANFSLMGEFVAAQHTPRSGGVTQTLTHRAYQVAGSWVLTGEKTSYNGLRPRRNFEPGSGGMGAWELAARYSALEVDGASFPLYASAAASARRADAVTGGLNWYLNPSTRVAVNYTRTVFAGGPRSTEEAVFSRLQVSF